MNNSLLTSKNHPKIVRIFNANIYIDRNHTNISQNSLLLFTKYTHANTERRNTKNLQKYYVQGYTLDKRGMTVPFKMELYHLNKRLFVDKDNTKIYKLFPILHTELDGATRILPIYIGTKNEEIFKILSSLKFKLLTDISTEKGMFVFKFDVNKFKSFVKLFEQIRINSFNSSNKSIDDSFYFILFGKNRLMLEHLPDEKIDKLICTNMHHEIISNIKVKSVNDSFNIEHTKPELDLDFNRILIINSEFKGDHSFVPRTINLVSKFKGRQGSMYRGIHDIV